MNKFGDAGIGLTYLRQINQRNKAEKSQFSSIVKDYSYILKSQQEAARDADALRIENEQIKQTKGDPILLRKVQEELAKMKEQLEITREKVALQEMTRNNEKRTIALEKRTAELDHIVQVKEQELEETKAELLKYKSQFQGLEGSNRILDGENKQLKDDNSQLAKTIVYMKTNQAEIMNKILQGVSHEEISSDIREIQNTQNSEAGEKETSLKPIYLRNPVVGNIRCPSEVKHKIIAHNAETTCIEFNNDGEICYTGGGDGLVRGWRVSDGKKVAEMQGFKQAITGISASLEGDYVVASSIDGHRMQLFRVKTNAKLMQYTGHVDTITSCKFNYSQKSIFSSSNDRTVREWDIDTAKQKHSYAMPNKINNMDLSYSENMISCCHQGDVRFLAAKDGHEVYRLAKAHDDLVTCAKFSPCERFVVTSSMDHTIKVWDVRTWQELFTPFEDSSFTCSSSHSGISISPDSQFIVTGSSNGAVIVMNTKTGEKSLQIEEIYEDEHYYPVIACEWQPRGSMFATADQSGGLYFWKDS